MTQQAPATPPPLDDFYERLDARMERTKTVRPVFASGFVAEAGQAAVRRGRWLPAGALPARVVGERTFPDAVAHGVRRKLLIGLQAGGGYSPWGQNNFRDSWQQAEVVLDGRFHHEINYIYDGRAGWQFFELPQPDDGPAAGAYEWCEIEKDGRLLYSGQIQRGPVGMARQVTLESLTRAGTLVGTASCTDQGGDAAGREAHFTIRIAGGLDGPTLIPVVTEAEAEDRPGYRRFEVPIGATDSLSSLEVLSASGEDEVLATAWVWCRPPQTLLISGAKLIEGAVHMTFSSARVGSAAGGALVAANGKSFAIGGDGPHGQDTVAVPPGVLRTAPTWEIQGAGNPVPRLPSLRAIVQHLNP